MKKGLCFLLFGCGTILPDRPIPVNPDQTIYLTTSHETQEFDCGINKKTLNPVYDPKVSGKGVYEVCRSRVNPNKVLIEGEPRTDKMVCFFPSFKTLDLNLEFYSSEEGTENICTSLENKSVILEFKNTGFNTLIAVEKVYVDNFLKCIAEDNTLGLLSCPGFSDDGFFSQGSF